MCVCEMAALAVETGVNALYTVVGALQLLVGVRVARVTGALECVSKPHARAWIS